MYRRLIHIIIVAVALMCALHVGAAPRRAAERPFTLVIDPGHGGKDTGCRGKLADEKTIVLDVGRPSRAYNRQGTPGGEDGIYPRR